jgi:flavin reductase (DIM6/NTAB) family NADH-FMN oxidoreductase RutF
MAGPERAIVGPVPPGRDPEGYDRLRRRVLWAMPSGLYVIGSAAARDERCNLMTCNWCQQVALEPKLVAVAVEATAVTHQLVQSGGAFSVSLLDREDRAVVRRFVKPVADVVRDDSGGVVSMGGQDVFVATTGAPILSLAVGWLDCELRHHLPLGSHDLFVGEIVDAGSTSDTVRMEDLQGRVLRMEDTRMSYGG